jgi:glycosyltransferase involved in cell wall biosynthesis
LLDETVARRFEAMLDEFRPDVVHVHHLLGLSADLVERAARRSIPVVLTLHDQWFQCPAVHSGIHDRHPVTGRAWGLACVAHHELRDARRLARAGIRRTVIEAVRRPEIFRRQLRAANAIVVPSRFLEEAFVRFGAPPERIRRLAHPVPFESPAPRRPGSGPVRFGYVGPIVPTKGVHVLARAFRMLGGGSTLSLHGPAPDAGYLRRVTELLGPAGTYGGPFAPQDARAIYASFDVLVVPSIVRESFNLAALEAQACGVPVVASRVGALPERVLHRRDGLLVRPGSARELHLALAQVQDRALVERFAAALPRPTPIESYAERIEELYGDARKRGIASGPGRATEGVSVRG